jgi:hypothetical protein
MSVKLKTPSNGSVTLSPEDTGSDVVLTVPAVAGEVVNDVTLRTELNATGSAPIYACRAWVNFNGVNAIRRGSGNVSSVTRHGTGDYTLNFETAMPDANFALSGTTGTSNASSVTVQAIRFPDTSLPTTTTARFASLAASSTTSGRQENDWITVSVFR